ncbi:MAG: DUF935 family protein [bacterium]
MEKNLLENKNTKQGLADEIATRKRSLNFYSLGYMLPDPDPVLRKQGKDMKIYRELLCDAHVFACVQSRKSGVLSLEWDINRGRDDDKDVSRLKDILKNIDIFQLTNDILDCAFFGFQPIEVIWQKTDNLVLPSALVAKPPEWFCFDEDNNLKFRTKENYWGEELPDKKFLCPQSNASYDNPYGERVLSRVFWPVTFKKGGLKFWILFCEKYGIPYLIGKHPRGASKEETETLADLLENMVQDAIAVISSNDAKNISNLNTIAITKGKSQGNRVYSVDGISSCLTSNGGGQGGKTGLYFINKPRFDTYKASDIVQTLKVAGDTPLMRVRNGTKKGYDEASIGDGISLGYPTSTTRRGRVGKGVSQTLDTHCNMGTIRGTIDKFRIRRLTPLECFRLQGFPDEMIKKAYALKISDAQLYKMAGNAVTVNTIYAVAKRIAEVENA